MKNLLTMVVAYIVLIGCSEVSINTDNEYSQNSTPEYSSDINTHRIVEKSIELSDGSTWRIMYDNEYNSECNMYSLNGRFCCMPDFSLSSVWDCSITKGCYLENFDRSTNRVMFEYWSGLVDVDGLPCYDYMLNGEINTRCVTGSDDDYLCRVKPIRHNEYVAEECIPVEYADNWFICEV